LTFTGELSRAELERLRRAPTRTSGRAIDQFDVLMATRLISSARRGSATMPRLRSWIAIKMSP
jgi:hypothetical protein